MQHSDLESLAKSLAPYIAQELITTPTFIGDRNRLTVGKLVSLINTHFNLNSGTVTIGYATFFGTNVSVITGTHNPEDAGKARKKYPKEGNNIIIGNSVWIASNSVILGPCVIEDNVVIAAGSVVLPGTYKAGCLYAGVPAVFKKEINLKPE